MLIEGISVNLGLNHGFDDLRQDNPDDRIHRKHLLSACPSRLRARLLLTG